jgi:tetratricopeptide (TPR) repeat protein
VNLGNVYALNLGDFDKAFSHYEAALRLNPEDGQTHYNYACVLDSRSELERAIEHYQLARKNGIEMAEKNLRNAMAKLIGKTSEESK